MQILKIKKLKTISHTEISHENAIRELDIQIKKVETSGSQTFSQDLLFFHSQKLILS